MALVFEWDESKAAANRRKHGVTFDEAASVFGDERAVIFPDVEHSDEELRLLIVGHSHYQRLLFVSHVECGPEVVRLIGARQATRRERRDYERGTTR